MALTNGPRLGVLVDGDEGELHYEELMAQWRAFDSLIQANVISRSLTAPPGSPSDGDTYIVGGSATGAWSTHDNKLARYSTKEAAWEFYTPKEGWMVFSRASGDKDIFYYTGSAWVRRSGLQTIPIACGDESTAITAGTAKITFHMPFDFEVKEVIAGLKTAQASGSIFTVDVNESGSSILSTKLTIDNTEETSLTAATPPVISDTSLAKGAKITIDVDQIGNGSAVGLKVYLVGWAR